ncbi:MAG TPA: tetratricopeptide repeat protein [Blastocatellia bacterium]|nr:tetratricopeptide repeat protein [Blastocatellia bacterium]
MKATSTTEPGLGVKSRKAAKGAGKESPPKGARREVLIVSAVLVVVVFAVFANALGNGFVFDDQNHIVRNRILRSLSNIPEIITASYRPIRDVTYALDFAIWGESAFGFHLTNIIFHAINTLLVFFLARRVTGLTPASTLAALIFAVHPLQIDSVTYISGRRDILFSLFCLSSFLSYLRYRRSGSRFFYVLFIGFWALGMMSKEMAASLPILIFVWNFCESWGGEGPGSFWRQILPAARTAFVRDRWLYLALVLVVPAYAYYMVFVKGGSTRAGAGGFDYWGGSFYTNILTAIRVHAWYLKQLVLPTPIVQYLGAFDVATTIADWQVVLSIVVVLSALVAGFALLNRDRLMAFAVLSYFVLLLPVSQIIPHHELLADHYLYLPLMSFGLLVGLTAHHISRRGRQWSRVAYASVGAAIIALAVMTVLRNPVYKDNLTLWQQNYREVPNSIRAASSLAGTYANRDPQKAIDLYKRCIEIDPAYSPAYVALAILLQSREKAREAEQLIQGGLALPDSRVVTPANPHPSEFRSELTTALAISKGNQGDNQTAERLLLQAIAINHFNHQPYMLLANYYRTVDRNKELDVLLRYLAINPFSADTLMSISSLLIDQKRFDEAIPYLERLLSFDPTGFYGNFNLGHIYRTKNECEKARSYFNRSRPAASGAEEVKAVGDALLMLDQQCK